MRNSLAARTLISTPRAGASLTKACIERTTPLICGSQASVMMRMRVNGNAGTSRLDGYGLREIARGLATCSPGHRPPRRRRSIVQQPFHRLGGRISELSRSVDLNLRRALVGWPGEPQLRCRHLERPSGLRPRADCYPQSPALASCSRYPASTIFPTSRDCDLAPTSLAAETLLRLSRSRLADVLGFLGFLKNAVAPRGAERP